MPELPTIASVVASYQCMVEAGVPEWVAWACVSAACAAIAAARVRRAARQTFTDGKDETRG